MVYATIFVFMAILAFAFRYSPSSRNPVYALLLLFLFVFAAFRLEVGCDWSGYLNQFRFVRSWNLESPFTRLRDPLWWSLMILFKGWGLSYAWLNVAIAVIFFSGVHFLAKRQPDRLAFLVLLFPVLIINLPMSALRQAAAVGVVCMAFVAFFDRRPLRFGALVLLASGFHTSAILFLFLLPFVTGGYSKGRLAFGALLAIPGIWAVLGLDATELAFSRYVATDTDAQGAVFRVGVLALSAAFFFGVLRGDWLKERLNEYKLVSLGSIGMTALVALLPFSTVIADRLGYYLVPIQAMMLARIPFLPVGRRNNACVILPYAVLGATLFGWIIFSSHFQKCYVPYNSWIF